MRTAALLIFLSCVARCQTPGPQLAAKALPSVFLVGGEYSSTSSPHFSGFAALAVPVSNSLGMYSYSQYQSLFVKNKITTSTTTGIADDLKTVCFKGGCAVLVGLASAGAATSTTTQAAFSGGGGLLFRLSNSWAVSAFAVQNTVGGSGKPSVLLGVGRTW